MTTLKVDYQEDKFLAILYISNDSLAWNHIKRVCFEADADVLEVAGNKLSIPWWSFLALRKSIVYFGNKYALKIELSDNAKEQLKKSNIKSAKYANKNLQLKTEDEIRTILLSLKFKRQLTPEQLRNVTNIYSLPAAATFSVPGAGKTTEALAYYTLKKRDNTKLLVICPKNAFAAWEEQSAECLNDQHVIRLTGGKINIIDAITKEFDIALITYQQVPHVLDILGTFLQKRR